MFITTMNPYKSNREDLNFRKEFTSERNLSNLNQAEKYNDYNPMIKMKSSSLLKLIKTKTKRDLTEIR